MNDPLKDLSNRELNRTRGGLGIVLALAGSMGLILFLCLYVAPAYDQMFEDM